MSRAENYAPGLIKEWKGRKVDYSGDYPRVYWPDHTMACSNGMVKIHRIVMSEHVGRPLCSEEVVHHKDEDRNNWSSNNLELTTHSEHAKHHSASKRRKLPNFKAGNTYKEIEGLTKLVTKCNHCKVTLYLEPYRVRASKNYCSLKCNGASQEATTWPSDIELKALLTAKTIAEIARDLKVSWTAVKKRCQKRNIIPHDAISIATSLSKK